MKGVFEKSGLDKTSMFLSKWDNPTFGEMIAHEANFRLPGSPDKAKQLQAFRDSEERVICMSEDLKRMLQELGHEADWNMTPVPVSAEISGMEHEVLQQTLFNRNSELIENVEVLFETALLEAINSQLVGEIKWIEPDSFGRSTGCQLNFFDQSKSRTLTKIRTKTFNHAHDLINARKHSLPALSVKKPKQCQKIIEAMPVWMKTHAYIVTGDLINAETKQVSESVVDNEIVRAAKRMGRGIRKVAVATASAGVHFIDAVNTAIMEDPALVVCNYVFCGWIEE